MEYKNICAISEQNKDKKGENGASIDFLFL